MARLLVTPKFKAFDTSGNPLASGKVYTYIAGTTTDKTTYTDKAAGTANTNPVILDSNGEADIWLDTDQAYKIVIKTSADVTLNTVDNVTPINDQTLLDQDLDVNSNSIISSSNGDIAVTPNGTGDLILDGLKWPQADGTANQLLKTDGSAQLSWTTPGGDVVDDSSPQLGGDLDANAFDILFDDGDGIHDESDNELLLFRKTGSAVNHLEIQNAATTNNPTITAVGDDTDVGIQLVPKNNGKVVLDLHSWPNIDGTNTQVLSTDGNGALTWVDATANTIASQAQMEAGTSTVVAAPPGRLHNHPGVAKAWVHYKTDTTTVNEESYNVTSLTDNGTGDTTVTFTTAFSADTYVAEAGTGTSSDAGGSGETGISVYHSSCRRFV